MERVLLYLKASPIVYSVNAILLMRLWRLAEFIGYQRNHWCDHEYWRESVGRILDGVGLCL